LYLDIARTVRHAGPVILNKTAKKIEQEESSENNAFSINLSGSAYPIGVGGTEASHVAAPCGQ